MKFNKDENVVGWTLGVWRMQKKCNERERVEELNLVCG
jgi:hypothetical protein